VPPVPSLSLDVTTGSVATVVMLLVIREATVTRPLAVLGVVLVESQVTGKGFGEIGEGANPKLVQLAAKLVFKGETSVGTPAVAAAALRMSGGVGVDIVDLEANTGSAVDGVGGA